MKPTFPGAPLLVGIVLTLVALLSFPALGLAAPVPAPAKQLSPEEIETLAHQVRFQSWDEASLTPLSSLKLGTMSLKAGDEEALIAAIGADEQYKDLKLLRTSEGVGYLYSSEFMSDSYARILLLLEKRDPCELMAGIVRENSEVYPRPTPVAMFTDPLFRIARNQVDRVVQEMMQRPENGDLHLIVTSVGTRYLYSDRYLDGDWAKALAESEATRSYFP